MVIFKRFSGPTLEGILAQRNKLKKVETHLELNENLPLDLLTITKNNLTFEVKDDSQTNVNTIVLSNPSKT